MKSNQLGVWCILQPHRQQFLWHQFSQKVRHYADYNLNVKKERNIRGNRILKQSYKVNRSVESQVLVWCVCLHDISNSLLQGVLILLAMHHSKLFLKHNLSQNPSKQNGIVKWHTIVWWMLLPTVPLYVL